MMCNNRAVAANPSKHLKTISHCDAKLGQESIIEPPPQSSGSLHQLALLKPMAVSAPASIPHVAETLPANGCQDIKRAAPRATHLYDPTQSARSAPPELAEGRCCSAPLFRQFESRGIFFRSGTNVFHCVHCPDFNMLATATGGVFFNLTR